jgi:hypothetical protein
MDQVLSWASIKPGYSDEYKQKQSQGTWGTHHYLSPYPLGLHIDTAKVIEPSTANQGNLTSSILQNGLTIPPLAKNFHFD